MFLLFHLILYLQGDFDSKKKKWSKRKKTCHIPIYKVYTTYDEDIQLFSKIYTMGYLWDLNFTIECLFYCRIFEKNLISAIHIAIHNLFEHSYGMFFFS